MVGIYAEFWALDGAVHLGKGLLHLCLFDVLLVNILAIQDRRIPPLKGELIVNLRINLALQIRQHLARPIRRQQFHPLIILQYILHILHHIQFPHIPPEQSRLPLQFI